MIKFLLVIPLLLSLSAYGAKDYFNEVIEHIENGSLTPQVFEEISMEKLIYLDCFVEADVSMNLKGKNEKFDTRKVSILSAFNNDIWLTKFDNHKGWTPYYYFHPELGRTVDAVNELQLLDEDVQEGSFQRYENVMKYILSIKLPYGSQYDEYKTRVELEQMNWSVDLSNILSGGDMDNLEMNYFMKRFIKSKTNQTASTSQKGKGSCKVL
jgi:hypothetical protein